MLGKDRPWKRALHVVWRSKSRSSVVSGPDNSCDVLRDAAICMGDQDCSVWSVNVGRSVSHHSGWLSLLQRRVILKKVRSKNGGVPKRRSSVCGSRRLYLGSGQSCYAIAMSSTPTTIRALGQMAAVGKVLLSLKAPRNIQDWLRSVQVASESVSEAERRNGYLWPWLLRIRLLTLMRNDGIKRLASGEGTLLSDLLGAFPDQKGWLQKLAPPGAHTVSELTESLNYDGPLELLTMYMCLFLGRGMKQFSPAWIDMHRAELIQKRELYAATHALPPHCFVLCSMVQKGA